MKSKCWSVRLGLLATRLLVLACTVSCTGCVTAIGYGVGARRDDRAWRTLVPPWTEALSGLKGSGVHLGMQEGKHFDGVLDGLAVDGKHITIIPYGQMNRTRLPGGVPTVQILSVDEIRTIEVGPAGKSNAMWGVVIGLPIDIAIWLIGAHTVFDLPGDL